jgi:phospholipid/cholesterol/gamma-HCH transport system permease protein
MLASTGRRAIDALIFLGEVSLLVARAFRELPTFFGRGFRPVHRVLLKQVYFTGVQAWAVIVVLFSLIGTLIISQIISYAGVEGASLTGKVLVWIVVRELGPLLTAIIVVARSGTAIATELASMRIGGEIDILESMGIPAARYLIMPRILGAAAAVVALALYAEVVAVAGGFLVGSLAWGISLEQYNQGIVPFLTIREIGVSVFKSFAFGLIIAGACCRQGLSVEGGATQIPIAATKGVMRSLLLVFLFDAVVTVAALS